MAFENSSLAHLLTCELYLTNQVSPHICLRQCRKEERGREDVRERKRERKWASWSGPDSSSPLRSPKPEHRCIQRGERRRTRRRGAVSNQGKGATKARSCPELDVTAFRLTMRTATMHDFAPLFAPRHGTSVCIVLHARAV